MTGGPSYAEAPDEAPRTFDDDEAELSVAPVNRPATVDPDRLDGMQPPSLARSPQLPLAPMYAPPGHIRPNPRDTSTSLALSLNPKSP